MKKGVARLGARVLGGVLCLLLCLPVVAQAAAGPLLPAAPVRLGQAVPVSTAPTGEDALPGADAAAMADDPVAMPPQPEAVPPVVPAGQYVVMDAATGQVLLEKGAGLRAFPASITKIMTLALVLEHVDFEAERHTTITTSDAAVDALMPRASMIALGRGEVATLEDLLYATKIESANDASHVLAEYLCGSMDSFAQLMNEKLRDLGLEGSHFVNPSGQPDADHFVTAYDMAVITRWALGVPHFREIFGATHYSMPPTNTQPYGREFHENNMVLNPHSGNYCSGVTGSKSGYTDEARYTLVTTAMRGETELICVALACQSNADKYATTNPLLDYCFDNFRRVQYPLEEIKGGWVPVYGGGADALGEIEVKGQGAASFLLHNSLPATALQVEVDIPEKYVLGQPFAPGAVLRLPEDIAQQKGGVLYAAPLYFSGVEEILAANTSAIARMVRREPVLFWCLAVLVPAALVFGVIARVVHQQRQREKRRQEKLAAARKVLPVRIEARPAAPQREGRAAARRPSTPRLRVAGRTAQAGYSRGVGRAR